MDELFNGVQAFVYTAEALSFRRAAERLGVSAAATSKAVKRLEQELGVALLHRSTRRVALTEEGAAFLERCRAAVEAMEAGRRELAEARAAPRGRVVLSMSPVLGRRVLRHAPELLARHPELRLELRVSDHYASLVDDAVDIALRLGELEDSALMARRLGQARWVTVASPAWLTRAGVPASPASLEGHEVLRFRAPGGGLVAPRFLGKGPPPRLAGRLDTDNGELLVAAARAGLGVVQAFDFMVEEDLRAGALVEILEGFAAPGPPLHALWRPGQQRLPRVRATLDWLLEVSLTLGTSGGALREEEAVV